MRRELPYDTQIMKNKLYIYSSLAIVLLMAVSACSFNTKINADGTSNANIVVVSNANAEPAGTPAAGGAQTAMAAAAALVADLYKQHDAQKGPFFQTKNRALVDKYFTKATADLIWKDAISSAGEVGALDGDPLYAAQDMEIKNFAIGKADVKSDHATLPVTFTNYGTKMTVTFLLKMVNASWKIDDIKWPEGNSMVKVLKENDAAGTKNETGSGGEFEGKFQVGDTTCTVKPVKMAFEVRWAKGSGVEMFFFKDGYTFESSADKGTPNRFEFDDEKYSTGTFYRSDGKEFPVKRSK